MIDRFQESIERNNLIPAGSTILVGFSGGPDSTCLLHLLKRSGFDVIAAHLNHGQRPEAHHDETHCQTFCDHLDIAYIGGKADVPLIARDYKIGIEEAGRNARYSFFRQSAFKLNANLIATGHNLGDNAETILFQLSRGTGLSGLSGIPRSREGIIRPLLDFTRAEIEEYCSIHNLKTIFDSGNENIEFSRVRIRQRIVPEFKILNSAFETNLHRTANIVSQEDQFLNSLAARLLEQAEQPLNGSLQFLSANCEAAFRVPDILSQPLVLVNRAIRLATKFLGSSLDYHQTETIVNALLAKESGAVTTINGEVAIEFDPEILHLRQLESIEPFRFPLTFPGETISDIFGWKITAETCPAEDFVRKPNSLEVVIDAQSVKGGLYLKAYETGERMKPLGMNEEKLISHILSDNKLTLAAKKRMPIIHDMIGPIWIPGCAISDRAKINQESQRAIRLKIEAL